MTPQVTKFVFEGLRRESQRNQWDAPQGHLFATEFASCPRAWAYKRQGIKYVDRPFTDSALLIFKDGISAEDVVHRALDESDLNIVDTQVPARSKVLPNWEIRGRIDFLCEYEGEIFPVELKTVNQRGFSLIDLSGPYGHHVTQLSFYIVANQYNFGRLLYRNRNAGEFMEFSVTHEQAVRTVSEKIKYWAQTMSEVDAGETIILRGVKKESLADDESECRWCPFKQTCHLHSLDEEDLDFSDTPPWETP